VPLAFYAALLTLVGAAHVAAFETRQPVEGMIALTRFAGRFEIVSQLLIEEGTGFVPLTVPAGKFLMLRQVTATCTVGNGILHFWTIRSSANNLVHHYLPIKRVGPDSYGSRVWISNQRVQIPVRAGSRPVATFQKSALDSSNEACVGSWAGYFEDAAAPQ